MYFTMLLSNYLQRNVLLMGLYGFICGMSLLLSGNTLNFWLASTGIDIKIVGFFALAALPYSLKYLPAILIDRYNFRLFKIKSKSKSWLLFSQFSIAALLVVLSILNPHNNLKSIGLLSILIALFSVIQDIVLNGNRISLLKQEQQSYGIALYTVGYRIGMMFSGAGIIFASAFLSWSHIFLFMASLYAVFIFLLLFIFKDDNAFTKVSCAKDNFLYSIFIKPIEYFNGTKNMIWILVFIVFYLLSDNMLMIMLNPFLLGQGYDAIEIAEISKAFGSIMVILGGLIGGIIINKISIKRSLIAFCFFNMLGHPFYIFLYFTGKNIFLLYIITGFNAFAGGMLTVAYLMFISKLSEGEFATTIYALLSSAMGLSRVIFPSISGVIVDSFGWVAFFMTIVLVSLLTMLFIIFMPKEIYKFYEKKS